MKLHVGNPANGIDIEVEVPDKATAQAIADAAERAYNGLRITTEACKAQQRKHETPEERQTREFLEEEAKMMLRQRQRQAKQLRAMLDGEA